MRSNPCRRLSLLGFAHLVVGPPLIGTGQVQAADRLTRIWDLTYEESQMWLWTIFCICILEQSVLIYHFV